ncbi:MAG: hypothetical protein AABW46_04260, partial [Nanoarchaeota archaeon]
VLLVFGISFALLSFSAQFGDLITGNIAGVSESAPFALFSIFILVIVFLIISLIIAGILGSGEED